MQWVMKMALKFQTKKVVNDSSNKIKITVVAPLLKIKWGGISVAATNMINCLRKDPIFEVDTVDINSKPYFPNNIFKKLLKLFIQPSILFIRLLKKRDSQIFHVHASNNWGIMPIAITAIYAFIFNKKMVVTYHLNKNNFKKNFKIIKILSKYIDAHIILSEYLLDEISRAGVRPYIVPNIVDIENFNFKLRTKINPKIIVARHLAPQYRIEDALLVFSKISSIFPNAELTIIGNYDNINYKNKIINMIHKLGLENNVKLLRFIDSRKKLNVLFSRADIFLNTSEMDIFPMALLEAASNGLIIVTTNAGGIPYLIHHKINGLVAKVGDIENFYINIKDILKDEEMAKKISFNARKLAEECSCSNVIKKLKNIYLKLLNPN
ncbi:glycosyltransferase [Aciduliprofundum sp. MAR08-339]|uniref:glycosyltransferase family 4 protein n=1 Tax=Aciduliprofundum sp. (strain MAR08-339) TaxID=673860 RepID=UPI0002A49E93|nr:glycosyltransferase [Aciduliprofundum sp. MAR08-339]